MLRGPAATLKPLYSFPYTFMALSLSVLSTPQNLSTTPSLPLASHIYSQALVEGLWLPPLDSCPVLGNKSRSPRGNYYPRSSTSRYWMVEEPINAPSKGALHLTIRSAAIIIWRFVNRSGTCGSKWGFVGFPAPSQLLNDTHSPFGSYK